MCTFRGIFEILFISFCLARRPVDKARDWESARARVVTKDLCEEYLYLRVDAVYKGLSKIWIAVACNQQGLSKRSGV